MKRALKELAAVIAATCVSLWPVLAVAQQPSRRGGGIKYTAAGTSGSATVDEAGNYTWTGAHDFNAGTLEIPNAASDPASCSVGMIFANTTSGAAAKICTAANTWTALAGIGGSLGATDNVIPRTSGTGGSTLDGGSSNPPTYNDTGTIAATAAPGITFPIRGFAPAAADIAVAGATDTGFWFGQSGDEYLGFLYSGTTKLILNNEVTAASDSEIGFSSATNVANAIDTGWVRDAANVFRATNGSTGLGYVLFGVPVEVNTATKSAAITESGECYTNTGDADGSTINLPNDPTVGTSICALLVVSQTVTIVPAAGETISDSGTAYSTSCVADALGESITLVAATGGSGATWVPRSKVGTWTCS